MRTERPNPHVSRTRSILATHPEIRKLFGPDLSTWKPAVLVIGLQIALAVALKNSPVWVMLLTAYTLGAVLTHALYVIIHECSHQLIFRKNWQNRCFALLSNFPLVLPSAMQFFKYHLLHHAHQGEYDCDPDIVPKSEAAWIGNSRVKKFLLVALFSLLQGVVHPNRLKQVRFWDAWFVLNVFTQAAFILTMWHFAGLYSLAFLLVCTAFCLGPHPLGGRWFAEHYVVHEEQETNSYYGPFNKLAFNVGYHNEHHDFIRIPWSRLPEIKRIAPEYYEDLFAYKSWTASLLRFVFDTKASVFDRMTRKERRPTKGSYAIGETEADALGAPSQ